MMKIILKNEVDNLGLPGDIVEVADGYGRNYLIPRGMAILATKGAEREAQALLRSRKAREAETLGDATAAKTAMESRTMRIGARVDDGGTLYGSVGAADIARVLRERGHVVEKKRIDFKSVKQIGEYEVEVQIHPQVMATITIEVVDESGEVTLESLAAEAAAAAAPPPPIDLDPDAEADAVTAAAEAADDSLTDVDALAEQALEAARAFEAEQKAAGDEAEPEAADEATDDAAEADAEPDAEEQAPEA